MTEPDKQIVVVGAGPVGALLAVFLARHGHRVTLLEKRPDMRQHAISAGRSINLALAERGIHALTRAGLMERVWPQLIKMRGRMLHDERGKLTFLPYGQRPHEVIYSVSRGELNKLLLDAAEETGRVTLHFSENVERIDFATNTIEYRNLNTREVRQMGFSLVVGADGVGSAVRHAIDEHYAESSHETRLFHSYKELYVAAGADATFRMEKEALHIWPRGDFMLIALPNPDGSFTATLFLPDEGARSFAEFSEREASTRLFENEFADVCELIPNATELFLSNPKGTLSRVHCPHWHIPGKALLIGDAAHAMVPFHGQGMNAGFEDCAEFDNLLASANGDWSNILADYEARRKPNAEAISLMADENYVEMRSLVRDPKFQLQKQLAFELERRFPERFVPRYSLVMFHNIPYSEALRLGRIQSQILAELCAQVDSVDAVDFTHAAELIAQRL